MNQIERRNASKGALHHVKTANYLFEDLDEYLFELTKGNPEATPYYELG